MMDMIEKKYAETGMRLFGKPFKAPHILFWNLRSTDGFPALSLQKNASMMSGFSAALLNLFCEEGLDALQSVTPWSMLLKSLELERYKVLEEKLLIELA
jgi:ABC-type amino acid transport substrate-binding protein